MECQDIIQDVLCRIKAIKGVEDTYVLNEKDKEKIFELEKKAEGAVLMGMGVGDNQGIKEVLKREIIIAFTTNMDYVWPEGPNVILMQYGEKVGEDIYDPEKIEECKKCKDMMVMGNFVIYRSAVPKPKEAGKEPLTVVLPPQKCEDLECVSSINNIVLASPSTPSDEYIRSVMGLKPAIGLGTFIIGFDFC
ncbi:hypothetical protein MSSAC_0765 [Methanosarcina siciliae C2J]|uniref:Uncharacterized protein n=2 Tax=Methanosarcina siciliae TaxID=38027 RepID=A0A0E3L7W0_9EURY|nr:hypothetical protein [Methanosarcina siciliae]AKB27456.1 hypothetical protein MSSIT_0737 [Methanosarcina siciliae T4/M]AKB35355.1 hypothetical protein MSSAC_0765 [Methanosarcina siciliae C2J]